MTLEGAAITSDLSGRVIFANSAAEHLTGFSFKEARDQTVSRVFNIVDAQSRVPAANPVTLCLASGQIFTAANATLLISRDGQEYSVEYSAIPIHKGNGDVESVVIVFQDVTRRKKIDQFRNDLVSTISHEMRAPLASIHGSLRLVLGTLANDLPDKANQLLKIAQRNSDRLSFLVNDILDMERISQDEYASFKFVKSDPVPVIRNVVCANSLIFENRSISVDLVVPNEEISIWVDVDRFDQVLTNLISNAAKFSPRGGEVQIVTEALEAKLRVSVIDQGPGIPLAFSEELFQPFSQADPSSGRDFEGVGLGLYIAKQIVEKMGGQIGFLSAPGKATTFWVEFDFA